MFGMGEAFGNLPGGQAEYVRVPLADMTLRAIPDDLSDESTIFTGDILATAFTALRQSGIVEGDTIAIVGAGPVGQLIAMCAPIFGAGQVLRDRHRPGAPRKRQEVRRDHDRPARAGPAQD